MRGRKPKPREQRIREGKAGHRPLPEPVLVAGRPSLGELAEPPADLPEDAKEFWRDIVVRLADVGILDRVDTPALRTLATQWARMQQAARVIASEGHFATGSRGQLVEHPALKIEREATALFLRLSEHFGITPVARTRLGIAKLQGRILADELADALGPPVLRPLDSLDSPATEGA